MQSTVTDIGFFGTLLRRGDSTPGRIYHNAYTADQSTPSHFHPNNVLYWVRSGWSQDTRIGHFIQATPDDLVFLPAGERHKTKWLTSGTLLHIEMTTPDFTADLIHRAARGSLKSRLLRLESELLAWDELSASVADELLVNLSVEDSNAGPEPSWLAPVDEYLRELRAESFSLDVAASIAGLHPTHLSRAYVKWTGLTLSEQVRFNRLRRVARSLRAESSTTVGEIAVREGFSDQSHLLRHFKRAFGCTPAAYRKS